MNITLQDSILEQDYPGSEGWSLGRKIVAKNQ
jgi:hypothetical protein